MNPLLALRDRGQSVWLDYISRRLIADGTLQRLIDADGLAGMTSNPTIFEQAIAGGGEYVVGALWGGDQDVRRNDEPGADRDPDHRPCEVTDDGRTSVELPEDP